MNRLTSGIRKYNFIFGILVVVITAVVIVYTAAAHSQIENYAQYAVERNADGISKVVDSFIDSAFSSIQLTSQMVSQTMSGSVIEEAGEVIAPLLPQTPFDFIEYIDRDGMNTTDKGEKFDAGDRVYYKEGIAGNTGIWINFNPKYSSEYLLDFYTPLYYRGEIAGVLTGAVGVDTKVIPLLKTSFFGEEMIGVLCDADKNVVASTADLKGKAGLDDILSYLGVTESGRQDFYNQINSGNKGTFKFKTTGGSAIARVNFNERTGWSIIQIVPSQSFKNVILQNLIGTYITCAVIIVLLLLYIIYVQVDTGKKQKEILAEKDKVVHNYEQILTTTASDTYKGIRRVDLETGHSDYIYFEDYHVKQTEIGDWSQWLKSQEKYINSDDFVRLREFLCMDNLRRMKQGVTYEENYKSTVKGKDGYYRAYTTTVSVTEIDGRKTAVMTTIDNTAAVVHEMEQQQLL
ncbi:MAG: cache domain-containing protein, partial [Lachnospiraceae bacterium]